MKHLKFLIALATLIFFAGLTESCQKENLEPSKEKVTLSKPLMKNNSPSEGELNSILQSSRDDRNLSNSRSSKVQFFSKRITLSEGEYYGHLIEKQWFDDLDIIMEVKPVNGDADAKLYGYNNSWRQVRESNNGGTSTDSVEGKNNDFQSGETSLGFYAYAYTNCTFDYILYYKEKSSTSNGYSLTGTNSSPSQGVKRETSFYFRVNVSGNASNLSGVLEFTAPDGQLYPKTMNRRSGSFDYTTTLSQTGTYRFRYKVGNQYTSYYSVTVGSNDCSQLNVLHYRQPTNSAKCVQYSVRMVLSSMGIYKSEQEVCNAMNNCSWSNVAQAAHAIEVLSGRSAVATANVSDDFLKNELCDGRPVIVTVKVNMDPNHPDYHAMVLVGMDDNYVWVNDPWTSNGKAVRYTKAKFNSCFDLYSATCNNNATCNRLITYFY